MGKSSWFKNPPKSTKEDGPKHHPRKKKSSEVKERKTPVSILFVPQTPFGALANKLKEKEKLLSELCEETVKIIERSGTSIKADVGEIESLAEGDSLQQSRD